MSDNSQDVVETGKVKPKTIIICLVIVFGMSVFGFLMVPLYNAFCSVTGLNGKTSGIAAPLAPTSEIDYSRNIRVQFMATINKNLYGWKFYPKQKYIMMHPGENKLVYFYAENDNDKGMVVQAIPSVAPGEVARYLHKTECFCFTQQYFNGHSSLLMPVLFHLEPQIPRYINTLTLSYTMFDADKFVKSPEMAAKLKAQN